MENLVGASQPVVILWAHEDCTVAIDKAEDVEVFGELWEWPLSGT